MVIKRFYLAHNFETRFGIRKWELKIEAAYRINLFNPFYDADRNDMIQLDTQGESRKESYEGMKAFSNSRCEILVERDLNAIQHSDGLLTIITSASFGTAMEIIMCAYIYRKPAYMIITKKTLSSHPWLRYMATISGGKIFTGFSEFKKWLRENDYVRKKKVVRE